MSTRLLKRKSGSYTKKVERRGNRTNSEGIPVHYLGTQVRVDGSSRKVAG